MEIKSKLKGKPQLFGFRYVNTDSFGNEEETVIREPSVSPEVCDPRGSAIFDHGPLDRCGAKALASPRNWRPFSFGLAGCTRKTPIRKPKRQLMEANHFMGFGCVSF